MEEKYFAPQEELLKCPQCGGNMEFLTGAKKNMAQCPYCGYSRILEKEETKEEHDARLRVLIYHNEKTRLRAQEEHNASQNARVRRGKRIALAIVLTPFVIGIIFAILKGIFGDPTQPRVDPFEGLQITFSGTDGMGRAEVRGISGVRYHVEGDGLLEEGKTVVVTASSDSLYLTNKRESYVVKGLDFYLTDRSMANEEVLSVLRETVSQAIDREFGSTGSMLSSSTKHYDSYEWKEAGIYLVTNGKNESHVIEAVELEFTRGDEKVTACAAYGFDGVIIHPNGIAPVSWQRGGFIGPIMDIGKMGSGSNPVWGTYMGIMEGFGSVSELETYIGNTYANLTTLQRLD